MLAFEVRVKDEVRSIFGEDMHGLFISELVMESPLPFLPIGRVTALTCKPLQNLRRDAWLDYAQCLADGVSLRKHAHYWCLMAGLLGCSRKADRGCIFPSRP